jgi:hypothetical protein
MIETRQFINNKVMTDFDPSVIPKEGLEEAINIRIDNTREGNLGVVTDTKGNRLISYPLRSGTYDFVGGGKDIVLNRCWSFFEHSGGYHIVLEFDKTTGVISKILEDLTDTNNIPTLNISKTTPFTGFNVFDLGNGTDKLGLNPFILTTWTDGRTEPREMYPDKHKELLFSATVQVSGSAITGVFNEDYKGKYISTDNGITWFRIIAATATTLTINGSMPAATFTNYRIKSILFATKDDLLIAKTIPIYPIGATYTTDLTANYNRLKGSFFQFSYQFVYKTGEDSAWSPYSAVQYPEVDIDPSSVLNPNLYNSLSLGIRTGSREVSAINVAYRKRGTTDDNFYLLKVIDKEKDNIGDNIITTIVFKNDKEIIPLPISEFSNRLYDNIPLVAGTQGVVNGNQICYGDVELNYNTIETDVNMSLTYQADAFRTSFLEVTQGNTSDGILRLSGTVQVGDKVEIEASITEDINYGTGNSPYYVYNNTSNSFTAVTTSLTDFAQGLISDVGQGGGFIIISSNLIEVQLFNNPAITVVMNFRNLPGGLANVKSTNSLKYSAAYGFGLIYGDDKGRLSGVSQVKDLLVIGDYRDNLNKLPVMEYSIKHRPPEYARWWSLVMTKNLTFAKSVQLKGEGLTGSVGFPDFLIISVKSLLDSKSDDLSKSNVSYTYSKGDRIKLIYNISAQEPFSMDCDAEIIGYDITETDILVKFKPPTGFTFANAANVLVELYTPFFSEGNNAYFEIGEVYPVINAGTSTRCHGGQTQTQDAVDFSTIPAKGKTSKGDYFMRLADNRFSYDKAPNPSFFINIEDINFSDYYMSKSPCFGRAFIIDDTIGNQRFRSKILFTDPILAGNRGNGSNKIYAGNVFDEVYDSKGAIKRLTTRGDYLIVIQSTGVCAVPVYNTMIDVGTGVSQIGLSRRLLNRPRYYLGDYGIENAVRSFAQKDNYIYYACPSKGALIRLAFDGNTNILDTTYTNKGLSDLIKNEGVLNNIIGAFDEDEGQYLLHFKLNTSTWAFDEDLRGFEGNYLFAPDGMDSIENTLISWKNGRLYIHDNEVTRNNFYGVQYDSKLVFVFNSMPDINKIFLNGSIHSDGGWYISKLQTSLGASSDMFVGDFEEMEGVRYSEFPMDGLSTGGLLNGEPLRGTWLRVEMTKIGGVKKTLRSVGVAMIKSNKNMA